MINKDNRVILECFLRIGDTIVSQNSDSSKEYRTITVPDGVKGVVIGFHRYKRAIGRNEVRSNRPVGIYEQNGAVCVKWETGETSTPSCHDIAFIDDETKDMRAADSVYRKAFKEALYLSPLPEVSVYEGDTIRIQRRNEDNAEVVITRIEYLDKDRLCNDDATQYPFIQVMCVEEGWRSSTNLADIVTFLKRGNYYWYEHDKTRMEFKDLNDEAGFYRTLGFAEEVRNPATGNYRWELDQLLEAIKNGEIDAISTSGSLFGSVPFSTAYRWPTMPELGKRLREQTLAGFEVK